ncbi:MAG: sensor histidine kinase [Thermoguttaceae bacterium]
MASCPADSSEYTTTLERMKLDALAEFAAGAGHEINNPLATILGHAQTLLARTDDEATKRTLGQICAQVRRAHEMIADLRLFSRPPKPEFFNFSLRTLLEEIATAANVQLVVDGLHECEICSDPVQLRVALDAILKNAIEATNGEPNAVRLSCRVHGETSVRIAVDDGGAGIPPEIRSLIFDPYFSGRQAGRGLGFGLCKAWKIAEQLGGTLTVEDSDLGGARFVLTLHKTPYNE